MKKNDDFCVAIIFCFREIIMMMHSYKEKRYAKSKIILLKALLSNIEMRFVLL